MLAYIWILMLTIYLFIDHNGLQGGYGSGAPESIFYDLPVSVRNQ